MFDWDDLRVFIATARGESAAIAARRLGVDPTTVMRRINGLESALKATLFVRSRNGLTLTAAGARLLAAATQVESAMQLVGEVGESGVVAGTLRLGASEGFGADVIAPGLPALRRRHPGLKIELVALPGFMSPLKREVDMVVTLSAPASQRLLVEPLTPYELGLYGSADYLEEIGPIHQVADLAKVDFVGYIDDLIYASELRYLEALDPGLRCRLSSSSIRAQREIIAHGGGVGVLPCFLANDLVRVLPEQVRLRRNFWMSSYRDVAETARVRAVRHWLKSLVATRQRDLLPDPHLAPEDLTSAPSTLHANNDAGFPDQAEPLSRLLPAARLGGANAGARLSGSVAS